MRKLLLIAGLAGILVSCAVDDGFNRRENFNQGWRFELSDGDYYVPGYDDSSWRELDLPHDWAIEGEFSAENPSGAGGGALPGGVGWYRKHFTLGPEDSQKQIYVDFDGVYMNSTVYINGHELGTRPYGYVSFSYDLTPYLDWEGENEIAVRVDNAEQPNSRWYSGCGIYRNVWLRKLSKQHIALWGTYVTAEIKDEGAYFSVQTTVENHSSEEADVNLEAELLDAEGNVVARAQGYPLSLGASSSEVFTQDMVIAEVKKWSVENPYLYTVRTIISDATTGEIKDVYDTPVGVREFVFDAEEGFILNGEKVKIQGVCMHHDLGCLGAAFNTRAMERQLEILKEAGFNGVRCAHNPPAPELLDLCDRMGFIVMDETFDMWRRKKTQHDYAGYFDEWHERDLRDLILRDRNHPSIFMWCIGNEVLEQWSGASADELSLAEANLILNFGHSADQLAKVGQMSVNSLLTIKLADLVRSLDSTRPITAGCNEPSPGNHLFRSGALDIIGFNYHDDWFAGVPENFPGKPFIVTESVSGLMTRGYYRMPSDTSFIWPVRWDIPFHDDSWKCSSYDNCHVPWGNSHEGTLKHVLNNDFISGHYIWTGFDYIGEPTPYGFPARSSYFGIVDLAGFPKDIYYMYQSMLREDIDVLHLFPHWNWEPGQEIDIWAYYNNADEVELFVNGESVGIRSKDEDYHVSWRVEYQPGSIRAVSRKDGEVVAEKIIKTAGEPAQIRLTPDRDAIGRGCDDLGFVTVEVLDKDGNLCPNAMNKVNFEVTGGTIAGVDNGCQTSMESFKASPDGLTAVREAWYGKCLVVVSPDDNSKAVFLKAESDGLASDYVKIKTER